MAVKLHLREEVGGGNADKRPCGQSQRCPEELLPATASAPQAGHVTASCSMP